MNCKKCGNIVEENEKFCLSCGTGIAAEVDTIVETPLAENSTTENIGTAEQNFENISTEKTVSQDFPNANPFPSPFQNVPPSSPNENIWSKDDPNLQFENPQRTAAREEWAKQQLQRAFVNGIFAVAFSVWTLIVVFSGFLTNSLWVWIFIFADFGCSVPAIFQAWRGRSHNRNKFLASMIMGIASTAASIFALIWWIAT
ncbi:MAG: zinc ribbon domain-containing protein [Firmicutes bacterium]|nr:zinc ribbon domain-containing protein [Bacillota bacterium]